MCLIHTVKYQKCLTRSPCFSRCKGKSWCKNWGARGSAGPRATGGQNPWYAKGTSGPGVLPGVTEDSAGELRWY